MDSVKGGVLIDRPLEKGDTVGKFVIERQIGSGGFGTVYLAKNDIDKLGAVKVLDLRFSVDPMMVSRFKAEARAANLIKHPNIIDIFEFGQLPDGRQYYIMEFLDGKTLDQLLLERGRLPLTEAMPILRGVARALDAAHEKGVAHRDLKPENVFLVQASDGATEPRLLDFGIAKLLKNEGPNTHKTRTGMAVGTPEFMSPEQCRGRDVDHRTDIYSFGCMLFQVLTGRAVFEAMDAMDLMVAHVQTEPRKPSDLFGDIPPKVDQMVAWLLKKSPAERPPNLAAVMHVLENTVPTEQALPRYVTPNVAHAPTVFASSGTLPPVQQGNRKWIAAVAGCVVAIAVMVVAWPKQPTPAPTPTPQTRVTEELGHVPDKIPVKPANPEFVDLEITGVPQGTEVHWPLGLLGVAPGMLRIPYRDEAVTISLRHDGFETVTRELIPSKAQTLSIEMKAISSKTPKTTGKKKKRNDIENPFR